MSATGEKQNQNYVSVQIHLFHIVFTVGWEVSY